jgi:ryanodine receptor 2
VSYIPRPIDTTGIAVDPSLFELTERLAQHVHELWAAKRIAEGWVIGPVRDDAKHEHPCLVPYDQLPDVEKDYDRTIVLETLRAVLALGYSIEK